MVGISQDILMIINFSFTKSVIHEDEKKNIARWEAAGDELAGKPKAIYATRPTQVVQLELPEGPSLCEIIWTK